MMTLAAAVLPAAAQADPLLSSSDFIIAIDTDEAQTGSFYFPGEDALAGIDGIANTKYLNLGLPPHEMGLAVEPFSTVLSGPVVVQSIQFTTADDAVHRDPAGYKLYGSNDALLSADNSALDGGESWTEIASGTLDFPEDRLTQLAPINISNSTAYSNYRVEFTGPKGGEGRLSFNGVQIGDVQVYTAPDAGGTPVFGGADTAIAYQLPQPDSFYYPDEPPSALLDYTFVPSSSYPGAESPDLAFDGDTGTKYLNFGGPNSGFIVTPATPAQVQSFVITSANDALGRHPTSYVLFGTNDTIVSGDNSDGTDEAWTEIASGAITPPTELFTDSPVVSVTNATSYSSYKMLFPTTNGDGLMQISEASFFESIDGTGTDIFDTAAPTAALALDTDLGTTKHFNQGRDNAGVIVTPSVGSTVVDGFQLTTANDATHRDPASYELYGTNDTIVTEDNGQGDAEAWVMIASGTLDDTQVPLDRNSTGVVVPVTNTTEYTSYKIVFPLLRDLEEDNGFQLADLQMFGTIVNPPSSLGDFNGDGVVDAADYTVWRDALGDPDESALNGNGDGGDVSMSDYLVWRDNYGADYTPASETAAPEPASALLVGGVLAAAGVLGRRTRRIVC